MTTMEHAIPDFICLGVPRGGTTWLDQNLRLHPEVYLAEKEIHFFSNSGDYDFYTKHGYEWYYSHFSAAEEGLVTGEIAIHYLFSDVARVRIATDFQAMRFIVMLRNPIDRFNSIYEFLAGRKEFKGTLREFSEDWRGKNQLKTGLYHAHLMEWEKACPKSKFCIVLQDDIKTDAAEVYRRICQFISVDNSFVPESISKRVNEPKTFRSGLIRRFYRRLAMALSYRRLDWIRKPLKASGLPRLLERLNTGSEYRVPMSMEDRKWLLDYYQDDIERLEEYLGRDLTDWKK